MFGPDVTAEESAIIAEYYERNERKKSDEEWLKAFKPNVLAIMEKLGKKKSDFGDVRVSIVVPDASKFNEDRVLAYLTTKGLVSQAIKSVLDEEKLMGIIETGLVDLDELRAAAWEEKSGTPRLTVGKVKKKDD